MLKTRLAATAAAATAAAAAAAAAEDCDVDEVVEEAEVGADED